MGRVARLNISENVCIHADSLRLLQSSLGSAASQDVIERAIIEVAERINGVEQASMIGDSGLLRKTARGLSAISTQLGLLELARVAQDVVSCSDRADLCALSAVTNRLVRVGDASLAAAIEGATPPN